jgi:hypothetical protein
LVRGTSNHERIIFRRVGNGSLSSFPQHSNTREFCANTGRGSRRGCRAQSTPWRK